MENGKKKEMPKIVINVYYNDNRLEIEKDESTFVEQAIFGDDEGDE
jgi:hypothetical protein